MYNKQPSLRLCEDDLKCKNKCGFYGNPRWEGYCSKCFKDVLQIQEEAKLPSSSVNTPRLDRDHKNAVAGFNKIIEKKSKQKVDRKSTGTLKKITTLISKPGHSPRKIESLPSSYVENPDVAKIDEEYNTLLKELDVNVVSDVRKSLRAFTLTILNVLTTDKAIEEVSDLVQNTYQAFAKRMDASQTYLDVAQKDKDMLLEYFEKHAMTNLYRNLFCPASTNDEEMDLAIQKRIRELSWVCAKHLECGVDETNAEVRDLVYNAITELLGLDSAKAPQDKLAAVVSCCRNIFLLLQRSVGGPASADEFLPALIFVVLKANPARFKSNVNYITRFCNSSSLMTGETGYYFTNLCCAMSFIEKMSADDLSMNHAEFEQLTSGAVVMPNAWESAMLMCESLREMQEHVITLSDLREQRSTLADTRRAIRGELFAFGDEVEEQVKDILERTPLQFKKPVDIDSENPIADQLPPPILPQQAESICKEKTFRSDDDIKYFDSFKSPTTTNFDLTLSNSSKNNVALSLSQYVENRLPKEGNLSLLDGGDSPTGLILPSPLKPAISSSWDVPSIPCNTGELHSSHSEQGPKKI